MKPELQIVEIAKYLGFKPEVYDCELGGLSEIWFVDPNNPYASLSHSADAPSYIDKDGRRVRMGNLPDYCNDLNAMHVAEKVLKDKRLLFRYHLALAELAQFQGNNHLNTFHATASQRAEAFLKTVELWKEE